MRSTVLAGVEMGGTKCVCTLGSGPDEILAQEVLPTRDPAATLADIAAVLRRWNGGAMPFAAIGVAAFGPLDLRRDSPSYGHIQSTPKQGWSGVDLLGFLAQKFQVPIGLTTDVIGAALAEGRWGGARGLSDFAYVTVGTGIGVGVMSGGRPVLGAHHPELGHVRIVRAAGDSWRGCCRFHGDCVEGLASGPAIEARSGVAAERLAADDPVWDSVVHALAQLAHTLVVALGPQRILMGGGVLGAQAHLFPRIRRALTASLNDYLQMEELGTGLERFIAPPALGAAAGPLGALAVAADALAEPGRPS